MNTENLVVNNDTEGEVVEHVCEVVPHVGVAVFARTLGVETVGLRDAARFVVSADEVDAVRVAKFEADEERDCFDGEEPTIHVVTYDHLTLGLALEKDNAERLQATHRGRGSSCRDISLLS